MSDRVELSEALRSILDDSDSETVDQKENLGRLDYKDASQKMASLGSGIKSCLTPINRALSYIKTGRSRKSVLSPSAGTSASGTLGKNRRKVGSEDDQSPPKKRRHANHVIILRQPSTKAKQQKSSPRPSPGRNVKSKPAEATVNDVKSYRTKKKEFTVELETGIAGPGQNFETNSLNGTEDSMQPVDHSPRTNTLQNVAVDINTPPRSVMKIPCSATQKYLEAAVKCQIKLDASEEEIESGLPVLDGLDPTASPFCHFTDTSQKQLYSELLALDDGSSVGSPWPANQEDVLHQMAASQQLLQCAGKFYFGDGGQPHLQGEGPLGRWVRRGTADDSLTNITWLKRMSAPDLDPNTLQTAQMRDPRFERPPYSYSTLIQFAISSSRSGKMTLREIYSWIEETFPYFKTAKAGWRNSIRHNLSLHKIFIREPPMTHGQPAFWTHRPGTVVRLPEHRMFVADPENGGTLLQEVAPPPSMLPSMMGSPLQGPPVYMGGAMPQVVMIPGTSGGVANTNMSKENAGSGPKTKKPPLILPRGSQPYALVPVPLLLPPGQNGGQTSGEKHTSFPHILSPIIMGGVRRFVANSTPQMVGGRKVVPIAPKVSLGNRDVHNPGTNGSSSSSSSVCNTSSGSDSGVDLSVQSLTSTSTSNHSSFVNQIMPNKDLPFKKRGQGRKSLPRIREDIDDTEGEDSFTAFFEQELASHPERQLHSKGMPAVSTPCKISNLQNWLSPLRGFTPFKDQPLDGDSGIFHDLHDDLSLTSLPTGLTPNFKSSRGATKGQRSRIGSLGELGLPGLTPEKGDQPSDGIHNQSFGQIFGDLGSLDIEAEGLDVGNLSWTMFSPSKQHAT